MADTIWNLLCNSVYGLVMVNFKLTSRYNPCGQSPCDEREYYLFVDLFALYSVDSKA